VNVSKEEDVEEIVTERIVAVDVDIVSKEEDKEKNIVMEAEGDTETKLEEDTEDTETKLEGDAEDTETKLNTEDIVDIVWISVNNANEEIVKMMMSK
jgi:hypothetical protein